MGQKESFSKVRLVFATGPSERFAPFIAFCFKDSRLIRFHTSSHISETKLSNSVVAASVVTFLTIILLVQLLTLLGLQVELL